MESKRVVPQKEKSIVEAFLRNASTGFLFALVSYMIGDRRLLMATA